MFRVIANGIFSYLSCALAGSTNDHVYTSPNKTDEFFDAGHTDTWYMKDEDGDGRDDYCRLVVHNDVMQLTIFIFRRKVWGKATYEINLFSMKQFINTQIEV